MALTRRTTSLLVLAIALLAGIILASEVMFVIFGGVLLALLIGGGGDWIAAQTGMGRGWGITVFLLGIIAAFVLGTILLLPSLLEQLDQLVRDLPAAFEALRTRLERFS